MTQVTQSELRQNIASHFDKVIENREPLLVTRPAGRGNIIIMAEDEFSAWQETVHLLSSPANAARLAASLRQVQADGGRERALLEPSEVPEPT